MKKIMFSERFGLEQAVLAGKKTQTRRIIKTAYEDVTAYNANGDWHFIGDIEGESFELSPQYQKGETVAIAQSYESIYLSMSANVRHEYSLRVAAVHHTGDLHSIAGWRNKMFVKANLMPNRIRTTYVKVERLQDITDEDCLKEGIYEEDTPTDTGYSFYGTKGNWETPREAFAALIDKVSGKGTWERNPWVFAYEFELIK